MGLFGLRSTPKRQHSLEGYIQITNKDQTPSTIKANEMPSALATSSAQPVAKWINSIKSTELRPRTSWKIRHHLLMKNELKLAGAFLALNAAVIALAVAGYVKSGMNFGAVLEHLR